MPDLPPRAFFPVGLIFRSDRIAPARRTFDTTEMTLLRSTFIAPIALLLVACASSTPDTTATPGPETATEAPAAEEEAVTAAGDVTFTEEQAERGRDVFRAQCTECHYSSEFSDSQFKFKWSRRTARNLYEVIQNQMPETAPGSLTPEETVDLVSYILSMNGFEPGVNELAPDPAVLDGLSLASIRGE